VTAANIRLALTAVLALLLLLMTTGCATRTVTVQMPIPVPCEMPDIPKPALPIDTVPQDSDIFVIDRALWASLELIEGYVVQIQTAMAGCRQP
jgi:hypothetical protein